MKEEALNELNSLLKGEQTAINAYEKYTDAATNPAVKAELVGIRNSHERHAAELTRRIRELGGRPVQNGGLAGLMADARLAVLSLGMANDAELLKKAYDSEDKGVEMAEELIKGGLEEESLKVAESVLADAHGHLRSMSVLIGSIENGERHS